MNKTQRLVAFIFFVSFGIQIIVECFSLDQLIKIIGEDQLGYYYSYSAILSAFATILVTYAANKVSSVVRYMILHVILAGIAAVCLFVNEALRAQLIFLCIWGFGPLIYFSAWSLASTYVTVFETKRLFPLISTVSQIGFFVGTFFAIASNFGLPKEFYTPAFLLGEIVLFACGFFLLKAKNATETMRQEETDATPPKEQEAMGLLSLVRYYKLIPRVTLWVFIWSFLYTAVSSLLGETFDASGYNLTFLYGILALGVALISSFVSAFVYPQFLKWLRLATIFFGWSIVLLLAGIPYFFSSIFAVAIVAYFVYELGDECFVPLTVSTELSIYPYVYRDKLRLLAEIIAYSLGGACVGLLFLLPKTIILWALSGLLFFLVILGFLARKGFNAEMLQFLKSKNEEEKNNAIALFDDLDQKESYEKVVDLLMNGDDLEMRINIVNTFFNLQAIKPVSLILNLLNNTTADSLKIAILRYLDVTDFKAIDPFAQHRMLESLKALCQSRSSSILRSMAIKTFVKNGPMEVTVNFILTALKDENERVVANAIEGLNEVDYPGVVDFLLPYLDHPVPRVQANTVIALWKYVPIREKISSSLDAMLHSDDIVRVASGIYAVGEVKDETRTPYLLDKLSSKAKELQRIIPITLLKLDCEEHYERVVDMILAEDEKQAINVCYLTLKLDPVILNERIIAKIYELGKEPRSLATKRYSRCGGFCRDQLRLLAGIRPKVVEADFD